MNAATSQLPKASSSTQSSSSRSFQCAESAPEFADVAEGSWYVPYVRNVLRLGIFEGYKDQAGRPMSFIPANSITLAELAKIGVVMRGSPTVIVQPDDERWYSAYLAAARTNAFSVFVSLLAEDDTAAVTGATRAQVVRTVMDALMIPVTTSLPETLPFSDLAKNDRNTAAVVTAAKLGIVSGDDGKTTFRPNDAINRAEVAKIVSLALKLKKDVSCENVNISAVSSRSAASVVSSNSLSVSSSSSSSSPIWTLVGTGSVSGSGTSNLSAAFGPDGSLYIGYVDLANGKKATVMKWNGVQWSTFGTPNFSPGEANYLDLDIASDGTVYVGYQDLSLDRKARVMRWDGQQWATVGFPGFSLGQTYRNKLVVGPDGFPYVAYQDWFNGNRLTVAKFNGMMWTLVGAPGFSSESVGVVSLVVSEEGVPHVAYQTASGDIFVQSFDGAKWGEPNVFGLKSYYPPSMDIAPDGTTYVIAPDSAGNAIPKVWSGTGWTLLSSGLEDVKMYGVELTVGPDDRPYIAFVDVSTSKWTANVRRWNGEKWVTVGDTDFSDTWSSEVTLLFDAQGVPHAVFRNGKPNKATVKKFTGPLATQSSSSASSFTLQTCENVLNRTYPVRETPSTSANVLWYIGPHQSAQCEPSSQGWVRIHGSGGMVGYVQNIVVGIR